MKIMNFILLFPVIVMLLPSAAKADALDTENERVEAALTKITGHTFNGSHYVFQTGLREALPEIYSYYKNKKFPLFSNGKVLKAYAALDAECADELPAFSAVCLAEAIVNSRK